MAPEDSQHPTDAVSSNVKVAKSKIGRVKIVVRSIALVLLGMAMFAFTTQSDPPPEPLSTTEQIMVGTWALPYSSRFGIPIIRFHADRTCEYLSTHRIPPIRWRIVDSLLVMQHSDQNLESLIGPVSIPIRVPDAVLKFKLPSFMARKNYVRSIAFSQDGRTVTLGPLGAESGHDLIRYKDEN